MCSKRDRTTWLEMVNRSRHNSQHNRGRPLQSYNNSKKLHFDSEFKIPTSTKHYEESGCKSSHTCCTFHILRGVGADGIVSIYGRHTRSQ